MSHDLESGISVSSFTGIASDIPLITTQYALRGIRCKFPIVSDGRFHIFIKRMILNRDAYENFKAKWSSLPSIYSQEQQALFDVQGMCLQLHKL